MSARSESSLITLIRYLIREATAKTFQDPEIRAYMNIILDEVHDRVERMIEGDWLIEAADKQNLTAGDDTVTLPADFVRFDRFEVYDGSVWHRLTERKLAERPSGLTAVDPPQHYTLFGDSLLLTPPPSASRDDAFRAFGAKEPTPYNGAASTTGLPRKCDRAIAYGAAWLCMEKEGNPRADRFKSMYETRLGALPSELALRDQEAFDPELD
jgi:hypothetical protein